VRRAGDRRALVALGGARNTTAVNFILDDGRRTRSVRTLNFSAPHDDVPLDDVFAGIVTD
jgi:hypothetical protein